MVKKIFLTVFVYFIFVFLVFFSGSFSGLRPDAGSQVSKRSDDNFFKREEITYDIKMGGLNLGKAVFRYLDNAEVDGKMLVRVSFETDMARFKDTETIYSDPKTFLPVRIDRDIVNWFNKEKITEDYDQKNFRVIITKHAKEKEDKIVIQRDGVIHNAILLPHYVRRISKLAPGYTFVANLPNRKLQMKLVAEENVKANGKTYSAYHFESLPKQVDIWISADENRIPLKMQGVGALGYLLVLREYAFKP